MPLLKTFPLKISYRQKRAVKRLMKRLIPGSFWQFIRRQLPNKRGDATAEEMLIKEWDEARQTVMQVGRQADLKPGVNLVGYLQASTGLGEAARSSIKGLKQVNIPFQLVDFEYNIPNGQKVDRSFAGDTGRKFDYQVNLLHVNPLEMPYLLETFGKDCLTRRYTIGFWYWELLELPDAWASRFKVVDEVWVASNFVKEGIESKSPVPVVIIPPCIEPSYDENLTRADFALPQDKFLFMCAYDVLSNHQRKNPLAAIEAFKKAFPKNDPSTGLVIKVSNARENSAGMKQVMSELSSYSNVYFVKDTFSREKFNALLKLIDAFVSLHRSEGFGLIPAEAMYLGKPVVMTNWSGNTDFMTEENSCGVNYRLMPVGEGVWPYQPEQCWAEADTDHAAFYMKKLFEDSAYYARVSKQAAAYMRSHHSSTVVGYAIKTRLEQLKLL